MEGNNIIVLAEALLNRGSNTTTPITDADKKLGLAALSPDRHAPNLSEAEVLGLRAGLLGYPIDMNQARDYHRTRAFGSLMRTAANLNPSQYPVCTHVIRTLELLNSPELQGVKIKDLRFSVA